VAGDRSGARIHVKARLNVEEGAHQLAAAAFAQADLRFVHQRLRRVDRNRHQPRVVAELGRRDGRAFRADLRLHLLLPLLGFERVTGRQTSA
jgi:hypothetical protein